jgi:hypothetical protein
MLVSICSFLGAQEMQEFTQLIDAPTAGILQRGEACFPIAIYKDGGLNFGAGVGIIPKLMFGIEYGGDKIIGNKDPDWLPYPAVFVKYRIFDESPKMPGIAIGFDSRGYGAYVEEKRKGQDTIGVNRYEIKSKGFYAVVSRNFRFLGNLGIHGGVNWSTERDDGDKDLNLFLGIDKSINPQISLLVEYDFAWNDNSANAFGEGKGYLNAGLQIYAAQNILIKFNFRDILNNQFENVDRSITLQYSTNL